ncbi:MAG: ComEA family DNA-binding protein [Gemmatimonadota bacterium]|jgi:competence protein ComEA
MSDAETRALTRAAAVILVASVARWGWDAVRPSAVAEGPDQLAGLLEESQARTREAQARARPLGPGERLDPNRASAVELDRLPGVGPATAAAIVAFRGEHGPFRRAHDLTRVKGVGEATLRRIQVHLDFSTPPPVDLQAWGTSRAASSLPAVARPPPGSAPSGGPGDGGAPVDVNHADVEALQTLPGIGPSLARRIVEARVQGPFRSVDDLTRVRGIGPATVARLRNRVSVGR